MPDKKIDMGEYFKRINYAGNADATEETLKDIQICHTLNSPFENLDVFYGKLPFLDETTSYKKIIKDQRGGYPFKMNGML
jgi:N-hydroxyarylamine O-acetyltransferase